MPKQEKTENGKNYADSEESSSPNAFHFCSSHRLPSLSTATPKALSLSLVSG